MNVVFCEAFEEETAELRRILPNDIVGHFYEAPAQALQIELPPESVVAIRTQSRVPDRWLDQIQGVLSRSTGFDHIKDLSRKHPRLQLGYLPDYCARSVAEHAVMMLIVLFKNLKCQIEHFTRFDRNMLTGREFYQKKIFVLGVGRIGSIVVGLCQGMGMDVKGFDIIHDLENLEYISLEEGLRWADACICALPLNDRTCGLLDRDAFERAGEGLIFINVSRGEISPPADLTSAYRSGSLGGIGLDVFDNEAMIALSLQNESGDLSGADRDLLALKDKDNILFTPHNAFNTQEALQLKVTQTVQALVHFKAHKTFSNPVPE